jgi:hypothetical protein
MSDGFSPSTKERSGRLRDRLYWLVVGVLTASIVWLTVGNTMWSKGSEPTTVREDLPSSSVSTSATDDPHDNSDAGHAAKATSTPSAEPSDGQTTSGGNEVAGGAISTDPMSVCLAVYDAQQQPLQDAAASMDQWQVHVGAMNKLVVGAISLAQATQFWNQTRVGAMAHLDAFSRSDGQFQQRTLRCAPAGQQASGDKQLAACQRSVAARSRVLHLAHKALATWRMHVMHMEMLREGKMSPARATQLWLQSWRAGQAEIDEYRTALGAAQGTHC